MADTQPKRGKGWLADKLDKLGGDRSQWREPKTDVLNFREQTARLVQPDNSQAVRASLDSDADLRRTLRSDILITVMSIRVRAVDTRANHRRLRETWVRCSLLNRLIARPQLNRKGIDHSKYSAAILFLRHEGLVVARGKLYDWTPEYSKLTQRAQWLLDLARSRGEPRDDEVIGRWRIEV